MCVSLELRFTKRPKTKTKNKRRGEADIQRQRIPENWSLVSLTGSCTRTSCCSQCWCPCRLSQSRGWYTLQLVSMSDQCSVVSCATGVCVGSMFSGVLCNWCLCRINVQWCPVQLVSVSDQCSVVPCATGVCVGSVFSGALCNWCLCRINVQWCPVQLVSVSDQCSVVPCATGVCVGSMFSGALCNWCLCRINADVPCNWCPCLIIAGALSDQCCCPFRVIAGARFGSMLLPVSDQCCCPCPVQLVPVSDQCSVVSCATSVHVGSMLVPVSDQGWCPFRIIAGARFGSVLLPVSRATGARVGSMFSGVLCN